MSKPELTVEQRLAKIEGDLAVLFKSLQTVVAAVEHQGQNLNAVFTAHNNLAEGLIRASSRTIASH